MDALSPSSGTREPPSARTVSSRSSVAPFGLPDEKEGGDERMPDKAGRAIQAFRALLREDQTRRNCGRGIEKPDSQSIQTADQALQVIGNLRKG